MDADTGEVNATIRVGDGPTDLAVSVAGDRAVVPNSGRTAAGSTLSLVNTTTRQVIRTIHLKGKVGLTPGEQTFFKPKAVAFLPGGEQMVAATEASKCVVFIDVRTGRVLGAAPFKGEGVRDMLVGPHGKYLYVSHPDSGSISVINISRRQLQKEIPVAGGTADLALTPDGKQMWAVNESTNSISILDVDTDDPREVLEFASGAFPRDIAFTRDGRKALCTNYLSGTISVYTTSNYKAIGEIDLGRDVVDEQQGSMDLSEIKRGRSPLPSGLIFADAGTPKERIFVGLQHGNQICEIDLDGMCVKRRIQLPATPYELAWARTVLAFLTPR
ncbi:MAG: beta-propeller fold lactonase family protein [Planctomycetota bacterium]